jgi:uroporphyrinogen-III decarboxylase
MITMTPPLARNYWLWRTIHRLHGLRMGPRLADAGVDVLYFVDPIQDRISLEKARQLLGDRMTLVGGTNSLSLSSGDPKRFREEIRRAIEVLGPTNRFILHPADSIFPDTPWEGIKQMIEAWREFAAADR